MDPDWFSMRWTGLTDFDFNLPSFESSVMAHADQIFSDGHLLPLHLGNPLKSKEASGSTDSMLKRSVSLDSSKRLLSSISRSGEDNENNKLPLIRPGAKSPGRILRKYLYFIIPLFKKVKSFKLISSRSVRSCGDSPRSSARTMNNGFSAIERRRINRVFDVDTESSIHEAVLHCKKSNGSSTEEA
ncbi:putative membrane-associated kinase regulator 6 [Apostasia shenzhenica]|uniref:Putative membrane-associated kinase regulator 6 n=1 Tax=Apostasia shenzhenica TaxID=1088818 RepID=A0A2I0AU12_9ASPA|nr:putative membrane-associated kinase regulator 6 [Apostasia shenzhenica]